MCSIRLLALVLASMAVTFSGPSSAVMIDLEEFAPPVGSSTFLAGPTFTSRGFDITQVGFGLSAPLAITHVGQPHIPNSGSNTLVSASNGFGYIIRESSGALFDLESLLVAEGRNLSTGFFAFSARVVQLIGTLADSSVIQETFALDLIAQEDASVDFELFRPTGFTGLTQVRLRGLAGSVGNSFSVDDIELSLTSISVTVAEPGSVALFVFGLAGLGVTSRRRKVRRQAAALR